MRLKDFKEVQTTLLFIYFAPIDIDIFQRGLSGFLLKPNLT